LIGMIITAIGFVVKNKGGKSSKNVVVTISDKHNDSNSPFSEQNKFFAEEITKDHDKYND
ncbi:MAG: hypothetical protein K6G28_02685, partial [Acholeplasmatales bacterium]|nr:hypothetical protein [Acholeplasmatales bacterium]